MIINKCYTGTFKIGIFVGDDMTIDTTKNKKYHKMIFSFMTLKKGADNTTVVKNINHK